MVVRVQINVTVSVGVQVDIGIVAGRGHGWYVEGDVEILAILHKVDLYLVIVTTIAGEGDPVGEGILTRGKVAIDGG
jgi:hypothetical protein